MNLRKRSYDESTLKAVQRTWQEYKTKARTNQTEAANALGMGQSALGQYLRGDIPLNTEFIIKIAALTRTPVEELGVDKALTSRTAPKTYPLEIKYALSGATVLPRVVPVGSVIPNENVFGVLADIHGHVLTYGWILIVETKSQCRDGDLVFVVREDAQPVAGRINLVDDGWRVLAPMWGQMASHTPAASDKVYRISRPESAGKVFGD